MANSDIITSLKDRIIQEIAQDNDLFIAIDPPKKSGIENGGDLINTHIFRYNRNPETIVETITFLTVMVNIRSLPYDTTRIVPRLIFGIYSHNNHMNIENIPGIVDNRNDYIAKLLDLKFNGTSCGIGTLNLIESSEGTYNDKYLYRTLIFESIDINNSFCGGDV